MCSSKMKEKVWEIRLDAQLPKAYQSTKASVEDEQEGMQLHRMTCGSIQNANHKSTESSNAAAQPGRQPSSNNTHAYSDPRHSRTLT